MPTPESIEWLIATNMRDAVSEWCIIEVDSDDLSKANNVIIGKPQDELVDEITLSIHIHHPLGPSSDRDTDVTGLSSTSTRWSFPGETTGGTRVEEIKGTVQIRARVDTDDYTDALELFGPVVLRIEDAINRDSRLARLEDGMGRTMFLIEAHRREGYESGGGNTWLDTQWVDWCAYVSSTNCRQTS